MKRLQERKLDRAWSEAVRERDGGWCRLGRDGCTCFPDDAHHIVTKRRRATRWDMVNGISLCRSCHRWIHAHPADGMIWLTAQLGEGILDALQLKSRQRAKFTAEDRARMLAEFTPKED